MKAALAAQMRRIDQLAGEYYGLPSVVLMENAGAQVAAVIKTALGGRVAEKKVCIFAGKGNNGGDGFVAARHLLGGGAKVRVFIIGAKGEITGDAATNLTVLERMGADCLAVANERDWDKITLAVTFADCLVDALVGTGFRGLLQGDMARAVQAINAADCPVVAVDVPSGVHADTGQVQGVAVRADHTVTFGLPKPGLFLYPGAAHTGQLHLADIGLPPALLEDGSIQQQSIDAALVRSLLPKRPPDAHKGTNGRVLVMAGAPGYTGAAALAAEGALRAGAGLVTLVVAAGLYPIMAAKLTEVITRPVPEEKSGVLGRGAVPAVLDLAARHDVLALGPGLGRERETQAAVLDIVREAPCPLVIDADGLNALVGHTDILPQARAVPVLTPHPGEMARLLGMTAAQVNADRLGVARQAAATWGSIVVLKGAGTVVAYPDGEAFINTCGGPVLATAGTGDVLTGMIAALIGQGLSSHAAAVAGVYLHGLAGDMAGHASGGVGVGARDVARTVPLAIKALRES